MWWFIGGFSRILMVYFDWFSWMLMDLDCLSTVPARRILQRSLQCHRQRVGTSFSKASVASKSGFGRFFPENFSGLDGSRSLPNQPWKRRNGEVEVPWPTCDLILEEPLSSGLSSWLVSPAVAVFFFHENSYLLDVHFPIRAFDPIPK